MADEQSTSNQPGPSGAEGIDPKLAGLLCYIWIIGIVFLIISKDKFVRFHAWQSLFLGITFAVLVVVSAFIPIINFFTWLLWPLYIVLVVIMMVKANQGEKYKLPIIGDFAEKNS